MTFLLLAIFAILPVTILSSNALASSSHLEGWLQTYGGTGTGQFYAEAFVQAYDGGFVIAGLTDSGTLLLKTDSSGNLEWNRTYESGSGVAHSLIGTSDGGYALVADAQLVKFDAYGNIEWNRTLIEGNMAYSLIQTSDGNYAIAGSSGDVMLNKEAFWLVKTDELGYTTWSKTYETVMQGAAHSLIQTLDGGYALLGSKSQGPDFLLIKTDSSGELEWSKTYGSEDIDYGRSIAQNSAGEYALAGTLWNRSGTGHGGLIKTDSSGNILWMRNYPGGFPLLMAATGEEGYILCSNLTLFKTDSEGNTLWTKGLDLPTNFYYTSEFSIIQTYDRGYAILGGASLPDTDGQSGISYVWLLKTDADGNYLSSPSSTVVASNTSSSSQALQPTITTLPSPTVPELKPILILVCAVAACFAAFIFRKKRLLK
jgi:hypothetical protein